MTHPTPDQPRGISPRRLAANRANAKRSTGPRTPEGKRISSLNAQKNGLYGGVEPVRRGVFREDPIVVENLVLGIVTDLGPRDTIEEEVALQIAKLMVRLRRADKVEAVHFAAIGRLEDDTADAEEVFDAVFNADLYTRAADDLETIDDLDSDQVLDLLLAQTWFDPALTNLYVAYAGHDIAAGPSVVAQIKKSVEATHGSLDAARAEYETMAADAEVQIPDPDEEAETAEISIREAVKDRSLEIASRMHSRYSIDLDRQLNRYHKLQARPLGPAVSQAGNDAQDDGPAEPDQAA